MRSALILGLTVLATGLMLACQDPVGPEADPSIPTPRFGHGSLARVRFIFGGEVTEVVQPLPVFPFERVANGDQLEWRFSVNSLTSDTDPRPTVGHYGWPQSAVIPGMVVLFHPQKGLKSGPVGGPSSITVSTIDELPDYAVSAHFFHDPFVIELSLDDADGTPFSTDVLPVGIPTPLDEVFSSTEFVIRSATDPNDVYLRGEVTTFVLVHGVDCLSPPPGLVGWWPLDETGGSTSAELAGNNIGTHINAPLPAPGRVAGGLGFNGVNQFVSIPHHPNLNLGSNTIEAWIRTPPAPPDVFGTVLAKTSATERTFGLFIQRQGFDVPGALFGSFSVDGSFANTKLSGKTIVTDGYPHHVAVTYDATSGEMKFYVDGILDEETTFAGSPSPDVGTFPASLGADPPTTSAEPVNPFDGLIDEVGLYDRALSEDEIQAIFRAGSAGKCKTETVFDADGDGIQDIIDTDPMNFSEEFNDGADAEGRIVVASARSTLTISDVGAPGGVLILGGAGPTEATVEVFCTPKMSYRIVPGVLVLATCGSAETEVLLGPVEARVDAFELTIPTGGRVTAFEDDNGQLLLDNQSPPGTEPILVSIEGQPAWTLGPEESLLQVAIDIKPGDGPNCLNPSAKGTIPVAILSSTSYDLAELDESTVAIGGVTPTRSSLNKDVSGDGQPDLVVHFKTEELNGAGLLTDGNALVLAGELADGTAILGSDVVFLAGGPNCSD